MNGLIGEELLMRLAPGLGLGIFLKASVVLLAGWVMIWLERNGSAATRYGTWCVALVLLIVLPLLAAPMPGWNLLPSKAPAPRLSTTPIEESPAIAGEMRTGSSEAMLVAPTEPLASTVAVPASAAASATTTEPQTVRQKPAFVDFATALAATFIFLWLAGIGVMAIRWWRDIERGRDLIRQGRSQPGPEIEAMARRLQDDLQLGRPIRVRIGDDVPIPFSWGIFRPIVILPGEARRWSEGQLRSVLAHELAHIARWDHLMLLLGELVRIVYWPNPLVWFAVRQCARERECSCDDEVLNRGVASDRYATHLLAVARSQLRQVAAIGMAGPGGLAERIERVMNERLDRRRGSASGFLVILAIACLALLPLATMKLMGASSSPVPETGNLIEKLAADADAAERRLAAWWLGEHESSRAVKPLIESLQDESADVRQVAAWALGEIKSTRAIDPLIESLKDEDPLVREMAVLSLGEIENQQAIAELARAAEQEADLREPAIWALGEIGGRRAHDVRDDIFDDLDRRSYDNQQVWAGDLPIRYTNRGRKVVRGVDITEDVDALLNDLRSNDAETRWQAAFNIGLLGIRGDLDTTAPVEPLLDLLRDPAPEVRAMAVWSLDEINPSRWSSRDKNLLGFHKHDHDHDHDDDHEHDHDHDDEDHDHDDHEHDHDDHDHDDTH